LNWGGCRSLGREILHGFVHAKASQALEAGCMS
jgi:hypothetical protein